MSANPYTKEMQLKQNKKPRQKRCKECNKLFTPTRELQPCCSFECDINHVDNNLKGLVALGGDMRTKRANKRKAEFKANDKVALRKSIQATANRYGRIMDYERYLQEGCITCGKIGGKIDGGHFLPTSTYPSIRYFSKQIKCQCIRCNQYNNGMPLEYEAKMRLMYGDDLVDSLKSEHRASANYSMEYMKKYIRVINKRIKKLELRIL
jgi:hypothetical protein